MPAQWRVTPVKARAANLVISVRESVSLMTWLKPSDQALVEQVVTFAQQIEDANDTARHVRTAMRKVLKDDSADPETRVAAARQINAADAAVAKAVGWLGPQIVNGLKVLGGTPAERRALDGGDKVGGRLGHLRAARARGTEAVDEAS